MSYYNYNGLQNGIQDQYLEIEQTQKRQLSKNETVWRVVKQFIWNANEGKFCQRYFREWLALIGFYVFFYAFTLGIWYSCFFIYWLRVMDTVRLAEPMLMNKFPGLHMDPKLENNWSRFIYYNRASLKQMDRLHVTMTKRLNQHEINNGMAGGKHSRKKPCSITGRHASKSTACIFDTTIFGEDCFKSKTYEMDSGSPCFLFALNNLRQWKPETFVNASELVAAGFPVHHEYNEPILANLDKWYMPISCEGQQDVDNELLQGIEYIPPRGIPAFHYPFWGQKYWDSPFMMIRFHTELAVPIYIRCKLWTKNVEHVRDPRTAELSGAIEFELMIDNAKPLYYHKDYDPEVQDDHDIMEDGAVFDSDGHLVREGDDD